MPSLLSTYIDSLRPLLYVESTNEKEFEIEIAEVAHGAKIIEFNPAYGPLDFTSKTSLGGNSNLAAFLDALQDDGFDNRMFVLLKDVHDQLGKPGIFGRLKLIAERTMYTEGFHVTIFIISPSFQIPPELESLVTIYGVDFPDQVSIEELIRHYAEGLGFEISETDVGEIALNLRGLSGFQIKQILDHAYCRGGVISREDSTLIFQEKKQMIMKSGLLELIENGDRIDDVGGLPKLKKWVGRKAKIFKELDRALKAGVSMPKGVLILGLPGCGKSLTAKAIASSFNVPLIRLDVGRLLGKYVGESEENMRKAFRLSEAISPCVLWIDEIEKAFAGTSGNNGHEVTMRLMGLFLTWMQEKRSTVFCVATSNNIDTIPPEFMRKGRFDEIFSVSLPSDEERLEIIKIHLRKRDHYNRNLNIFPLVKKTEGFSGADIEAGVGEAVESIFLSGKNCLETKDLEEAFSEIVPISVSLKEKLNQMKEAIKKYDVKTAS